MMVMLFRRRRDEKVSDDSFSVADHGSISSRADEQNLDGSTGAALGNVLVSAIAAARTNFSCLHLKAAHRFADILLAHEAEHRDKGWGEHFEICHDYGSAAIIMSFAAIEAAVGEAYSDLHVPEEIRNPLERSLTLAQAQAILTWLKADLFDKGGSVYQRVNLLRQVRNGLVHAKSEWSNELDIHKKLSIKIVQQNVALSPFAPSSMEAFPRGCMSAAFSQWAAETARLFIREFRILASLPCSL